MPADPYTVVEDAIYERWPTAPCHAITAEAIRALLDAGYQITHGHDCARQAINDGALEQVGWRFEAVAPRSATEPRYGLMTYLPGEAGHSDHERLYRVVTDNQETET